MRLVIIGASAMGREVCAYARECGMDVKGFLDSRSSLLDDYEDYPTVLGSVDEYEVSKDDVFVCAVGDSDQRQKYVDAIVQKGGEFVSIVHPKAYVGHNVRMGEGCVICPNATLTADIRMGKHVIVNVNSSISHDCVVGDFTTISPGCNIAGWCNIGERTFLGTQSAVIPHIETGVGVYIAAGAVVVQSVIDGRVMGVPAKKK